MLRTLSTALLIAWAAACAPPSSRTGEATPTGISGVAARPAVGEVFRLRTGEVASLENGALAVLFRGVTSDSRCPTDANCIWAGDAIAAIGTSVGSGAWQLTDLHTHLQSGQAEAGQYTIILVGLEPNPKVGERIRPEDYVAVLRVDRKQSGSH